MAEKFCPLLVAGAMAADKAAAVDTARAALPNTKCSSYCGWYHEGPGRCVMISIYKQINNIESKIGK